MANIIEEARQKKMNRNEVFWVDVNHNKLTKDQVNDNYLKNIIKFVCTGGGYYEEMSEDMIRELFKEAKKRQINITGYTLKQALDEYKSGTTIRYKLFIPNYDFPDYGDKLNPAIDARNVRKNQEQQFGEQAEKEIKQDKEIEKLKKENQQLKQSQKQLAIEELEKLKKELYSSPVSVRSCGYVDFEEILLEDVYDVINQQIKKLKGEKNE